jgi:hypothetical protein
MLLLGLVLIALGVLAIVGGVTTTSGNAGFLGFDDISATAIFFVGLGSGVAVLLGLAVIRSATRRSMAQRRERKRLGQLSDQLDQVDRERRHDDDEDRPTL